MSAAMLEGRRKIATWKGYVSEPFNCIFLNKS